MLDHLRAGATKVLTPAAKLLLRMGVSPDAVTVTGTLAVVIVALWLFPVGHLTAGALVLSALVFTDAIDGIMARTSGRVSVWGAFLDSTLDRVADAAIFAGIAFYLLNIDHSVGVIVAVACLGLGGVVPYARARAESLGMDAQVGIAERADRLAVALAATLAVGLGAPVVVLVGALGLLALAAAITVWQRMATVYRQSHAPALGLDPVSDPS